MKSLFVDILGCQVKDELLIILYLVFENLLLKMKLLYSPLSDVAKLHQSSFYHLLK